MSSGTAKEGHGKGRAGPGKALAVLRKSLNARDVAGTFLKLWWLWCLLSISAFTLWSWALPVRYGELLGLDEFYNYRMSEYVLTHDLQMPGIDYMRYWPDGVQTMLYDYAMDFYIPILFYYIITFLGSGMSFFSFALLFPALSGAFSVLVMYFIGREIFGDRMSGLLSSLFLATAIGYISRTSGALYEKECIGGPFMLLFFYFFIRSYRRNSLPSGIAAGATLALASVTWGGSMIIYYVVPSFLLLMLLANKCGPRMIKASFPTFLIGIASQQVFSYTAGLMNLDEMMVYLVLALMAARYLSERYKIVKAEHLPYLVPGMLLILLLSFLVGSMFSDYLWGLMSSLTNLFAMQKSNIGTTVAEQMPGDWSEITTRFDISFAISLFPQLSQMRPLFSVWLLMLAGSAMMIYASSKKRGFVYLLPPAAIVLISYAVHPIAAIFALFGWILALRFLLGGLDEGKDMMIFTVVWLTFSLATVFYMVRLVFFVGPPAALAAAFAVSKGSKMLTGSKKLSSYTFNALKRKIPVMAIPVAIYLTLLIAANVTSAYAYCNGLTTSFNSYWADAMNYMKTQTPVNSSILSWWDFGYWFQTRGERPSIADGGNVNGTVNEQIADWFVSRSGNWTSYRPWLRGKDVKYILMDYTLPGKYGAISKIASRGKTVIGMLQFQQTGSYPQENKTIMEYTAGEYAIWLPVSSAGGIAGPPMFMITKDGQYVGRTYINDLCTTSGIIHIETPEGSQSMPGCITITAYGLFYIPAEAEFTIFTNLMFMDGYGNPDVTKVYDNQLIKIYRLQINETLAG